MAPNDQIKAIARTRRDREDRVRFGITRPNQFRNSQIRALGVEAKALPFLLSGVEDPGPVAKSNIQPFLAEGCAEFDREFVQHQLDVGVA